MNSKNRTILIGVAIGAVTGLVAAVMLNRRADEEGGSTALTTGDGLKLGVMVVGLLRAISTLGAE